MDPDTHFEAVCERIRAAGELLRSEVTRDGGPRGSGFHADVDDEICAYLVAEIGALFPDDTIVSEELPTRAGTSGRVWHIDPHDGTHHFLQGSRETSISVGLAVGSTLPLGIVYAPLTSALTGPEGAFVAWVEGHPLTLNGQPVTASPDPSLPVLVSPAMRGAVRERAESAAAPLKLAGCGSVATRFALTACGQAGGGVCLYNVLASWDFAAGQALLQARGGALVDGDGQPILWRDGESQAPRTMEWFGAPSLAAAQELARRYRALIDGGSDRRPT